MRRLRNFFLLAIGVVIGVAGCGGGGGDGTTPVTTYSIVASAGPGGSITPSGTTTVTSGTTQNYSISPAAGYAIQDVLVDGVSVGAVSSYIFSNVIANHTITASFASITKAVVTIAINKPINNLDSLKLKVTNTDGATFTSNSAVALNEALASSAFIEAGIAVGDPSNLVSVGLASVNGFNVIANSPIIQLDYAVSSGVPNFTISSVPSSSIYPSVPIILYPSDFVVKVTYQ